MTNPLRRRLPGLALSCLVLLAPGLAAPSDLDVLDTFDDLLRRHVTTEGVRYDAWRSSPDALSALKRIAATLAAGDPAALDAPARHALYINLYNARVVELIVERAPRESILELSPARSGSGVFDEKLLRLGGATLSLNALEQRLRRESGDPRVHFAVNCAARSCPPLAPFAFRGAQLDEQLERRTSAFLASPIGVAVEYDETAGPLKLRVSKIFDWYAGDFVDSGGVVGFIRAHAAPGLAGQLATGRVELRYADYDWSLNRAP